MRNKGILLLISILAVGLMPMSLISGETTPPNVEITSHTWDQNVSGTITITATASDSGSGIDYLAFYFGGEDAGTDDTAPYTSDSITVKNFKEGPQTIAVVAFDNDGNFAADNVIVNVVINEADYDKEDTNFDDERTDSDRIWFVTYNIKFDNSEAYVIDGKLRKVEFDWSTDDYNRNGVVCKWYIWGSNFALNPEYDVLDDPGSGYKHVKLIFGPDEFTKYSYPSYLYIHVKMFRYGSEILTAGHELFPS